MENTWLGTLMPAQAPQCRAQAGAVVQGDEVRQNNSYEKNHFSVMNPLQSTVAISWEGDKHQSSWLILVFLAFALISLFPAG